MSSNDCEMDKRMKVEGRDQVLSSDQKNNLIDNDSYEMVTSIKIENDSDFSSNSLMTAENNALACQNNYEIDSKIKIKGEDHTLGTYHDNDKMFAENPLMTVQNNALLCSTTCESNEQIKGENESNLTPYPLLQSNPNENDVNRKFKVEDNGEDLSPYPVMMVQNNNFMCNDSCEMDIKIEIKEEFSWQEKTTTEVECQSEISSVSDLMIKKEIKDDLNEDYSSEEVFRLQRGVISKSSDMSTLFSCGDSEKPKKYKHESKDSEKSNLYNVHGDHIEVSCNIYDTRFVNKFNSEGNDSISPHKCFKCGKQLAQLSKLKSYKYCQQDTKPCEKCSAQMAPLKTNTLLHHGKSPHRCDMCGKSFTTSSHLKRHKLSHEGNNKPHKCETCEKSFAQMSQLKIHSLLHQGISPHKCDVCGKCYTTSSHLKRHKLSHESRKPFKCDICDKTFTEIGYFRIHNLIHKGKLPFKCDTCEESFTNKSSLKTHSMLHKEERPYKCDICERRFTMKSVLKMHKLYHEGVKPYKCEICNKGFTRIRHLRAHKLNHEGRKPHKCDICEKGFIELRYLRAHMWKHEGKRPHKCNVCEKSFIHHQSLRRHNLKHFCKDLQ